MTGRRGIFICFAVVCFSQLICYHSIQYKIYTLQVSSFIEENGGSRMFLERYHISRECHIKYSTVVFNSYVTIVNIDGQLNCV